MNDVQLAAVRALENEIAKLEEQARRVEELVQYAVGNYQQKRFRTESDNLNKIVTAMQNIIRTIKDSQRR